MTPLETSVDAAALHNDALVADISFTWMEVGGEKKKLASLPRFKASGVNFVSLTLACDSPSLEDTVRKIAKERNYFLSRPDEYVLVETVSDIRRAKKEGKLAIGFHFQGTEPIQRNLHMLEVYHRLGVKQMMIAYNEKNSAGDGCHERTDAGLSRFGIRMIAEMNRLGILVDVTHTGYRTTMDVFEVATAPVIFSHSNSRALHDHPRNISDEQIRKCAASGGVVGINGVSIFLNGNNDASAQQMVRHIDYVAQKVGADHVGIGLDYVYDVPALMEMVVDHADRWPEDGGYKVPTIDFVGPERLPEITESLLKLGYKEHNMRKILGENWLRVAQAIWK